MVDVKFTIYRWTPITNNIMCRDYTSFEMTCHDNTGFIKSKVYIHEERHE